MINHKLVGHASYMPYSDVFTMAAFNVVDVPSGEPLFIGKVASSAPELLKFLQEVFSIGDDLVEDVYGLDFVINAKSLIEKLTDD